MFDKRKDIRTISVNGWFDSFQDSETVFAKFRKLLDRAAAQN
jgi:hypothetical protein